MAQAAPPVIVPAGKEEPPTVTAQTPGESEASKGSQTEGTPKIETPSEPKSVTPPSPRKPPPTPNPTPETPGPAPSKPSAPVISPQMSPEEQDRAQKKVQENLNAAEQTLQKANSVNKTRGLAATEHDLFEKIQGFVTQTHEAMRASDWQRARNLSEKAYLLAVELNKSL